MAGTVHNSSCLRWGPRRNSKKDRRAAGRPRRGVEEVNRIGQIQRAAVVRVGALETGGCRAAEEEMVQEKDGVGEVRSAVGVGVAAAEAGCRGRRAWN